MSNKKDIIKISVLLILTTLVFSFFVWKELNAPKSSSGDLLKAIEELRFYGIKNTPSTIRKIGSEPVWLKSSMGIILTALDSGRDMDGFPLTESEYKELISVSAIGGRYAQSATGVFLKVFNRTESLEIKKYILRTLVAARSSYNSVKDDILPYCKSLKKDQDIEKYACVSLFSLINDEQKDVDTLDYEFLKQKVLPYRDEAISKLGNLIEDTSKKNYFSKEALENFQEIVFYISLFGRKWNIFSTQLEALIEPFDNEELKILVVNTLGFVTLEDDEHTINLLNGIMQYGSSQNIRKEALLSLISIGSESALLNARSYGHKYIQGDTRPAPMKKHPFISWVKGVEESIEKVEK